MPEYNIELSYYTTVKARNRDSACNKARKELKKHTDDVEVSYCEKR
jgi:hypothetical protein